MVLGEAFQHRFRYFILLLGWICLTSISSNMLALNFTLICMSPPARESSSITQNLPFSNVTTTPKPGESSPQNLASGGVSGVSGAPTFDYTRRQKDWLMWIVGVGSLIGTFPFSWLCTRYGARWVLFGSGLISAVSTALIPFAAVRHFNLFLAMRFLQGISYAADFATVGVICSRWASLKQYAFFISVLTCFTPLSSSITNAVSGVICESRFGWPMVFYSHAAVCLVLFGFWIALYNDHPKLVKAVSGVELEKINRNKSKAHIEMDKYVPYKAILTDPLILVIWLNSWCDIFTAVYTLMYIPSYFKYVLNLGVQETGLFGALPTFLSIITRIVFGYGSDAFQCISERSKIITYNTVAVAIPGLFFLAIGFVPAEVSPMVVVLMFIGMHVFFSVSGGGFYKCAALYTRQYYHFVIANIQFVKCFSLFLGPFLMTLFVRDETRQDQWRTIFIMFAALLVTSNILFCCLATDQQAEFTKDSFLASKKTKQPPPPLPMDIPSPEQQVSMKQTIPPDSQGIGAMRLTVV